MIKALKEIKRQADLKIENAQTERDGEGRRIINMNVRDDAGFISPFADTAKPVIGGEVADFITSRASAISHKERLTLRVYGDCIDESEREVYRTAIKEYYTESYAEKQREYVRNLIASIILGVIGVIMLGVMIWLEETTQSAVWIEVIDIVAWVFVWEAVDIAFLENGVTSMGRRRCLALIDMKVEFYPGQTV